MTDRRTVQPIQPSQSSPRAMTSGEWAMLLTLSLLWGASFLFNGIAVTALPPLTIVVVRVAVAALALVAALAVLGISLPRRRDVWAAFFAMGLLNNAVPFTLIVWAQGHLAAGLASILNATTPLFTVLLAQRLMRDERIGGRRLAGLGFGFAGVVVLVGPGVVTDAGAGTGAGVAAPLACLAAAISYALAGIFGRRFRAMGVAPLASASGQVIASSLLLLPVALMVDRPWTLPMPSADVLAALAGLALLSTAAAYGLYFRILATAGATNLMLVTFLVPVSAVLAAALVLGERLAMPEFAGMALIGIGLAFIDGRLLRRFALRQAR